MLFVLSIVSLFVATSWSQPIGVTSFYRDSSCTTSPYQLEITYGNLCVYGRANYTSTKITPEFYANVFPVNNTVEIYEYASGTYPTATCIGSYKSSIQKIPTACTLETDPMTGQSYYRSIQLLLSDPGIAVLTNNRPYALVSSYDAMNCTGLYKQTIYIVDPCAPVVVQGHMYGRMITCNATGIMHAGYNSTTCDPSTKMGETYDFFAHSPSCYNMEPPANNFNVNPTTLALSYSYTCVSSPSTGPSTAPVSATASTMAPMIMTSSGPTSAPITRSTTTTVMPSGVSTSSSSSSNCFSAQSTMQLFSGEVITMAEASVGDIVLVSSMDGQSTSFKSIVSVPHGKNTIPATFLKITTVTGKSIQMTPDHLVLGGPCADTSKYGIVLTSSMTTTDCLYTVDGKEAIASITQLVSEGVYTVVTESADDLLVVNGVIVSPFSGNHAVANAFYNIVRMANKIIPSIMKSSPLRNAVGLFGDIAVSV